MRPIGFGLAIHAAAAICASVAIVFPVSAAAPGEETIAALGAILPAQAGNKACFTRVYDADHKRAHPRQRITAMTFLLRVETRDPKEVQSEKPSDLFYYVFAMSVKRRGDKGLLRTAGDCSAFDAISCVVDCDGGGLTLDKMPPANSLMVRLNEEGIVMYHDCDGEDKQAVLVKPGADDKVFRLEKTSDAVCRALDEHYYK
jgi:hypothetical protein